MLTNLKKILGLTLLALFHQISFGQIFQETFDEPNGSTNGVDNIGGVAWNITCPGCTGNWDVNGNEWVINNTDSPAYWETTVPIDISSCEFIEIQVELFADGDFESCGGGCNASDWISLEYNIDGAGWTAPANASPCVNGCPDGDVIFTTDTETGETLSYSTGCTLGGNSMLIRIYGQNWAGGEFWRIDDITVSCATGPTVGAGVDQLTCEGQQVTLTANNPDGATISWDNGVTDGVAFTPPVGLTTYEVVGLLGTCSDTDYVDVTVNPGPSFTLSYTDPTICVPGDGTITIGGLTPGTSYDVSYDDGSVQGPTTIVADGSGEITFTNLDPGSYTDFTVDSLGCVTVDPSQLDLVAPASPSVDAGVDQTVCEGDNVTLTASNPDGAVITWDNGVVDGVPFSPAVGTLTYTVSANLAGCISTDQVDVTVLAIPNVNVTPAGPFTTSSGVQTMSATPGGGTWTSDCGACINATTGQFDPNVAGVGTWQICYEAGTAPCTDQECINVQVDAPTGCPMTGTISSNNPTCYQFNDGSVTINISGETGTPVFVITNSQGAQVNIGNSNTANNLTEGWYYFDVTDDFPCQIIDSVFIEDPGQLDVDLVISQPTCYGLPNGMVVADTVYNYTGNYNLISYIWSPNPGGVNGIGADTLANLGEDAYTLLINDENGCDRTFDFDIIYPDSLYFQEIGYEPAYCRLFSYQSGNGVVYAAAAGGTPDYAYQWIDLSDSTVNISTTWGGLNPGDYEMTVTDDNGCTLVQVVTIDSLNPTADFEMYSDQFTTQYEGTAQVDVNFENLSMYYANPNNPNADTTFFWHFGYETEPWVISHDVNETFDTSYYVGDTYEVCLVAINKNGCSDTLCKEMIIYDPLAFKPVNVFTPNGDGVNDEFTFQFVSIAVAEFHCVIVDRWGVQMYEMNSIDDSWDGTNKKGKPCPDGVYYYVYTGTADNGETFDGQGNITITSSN